MNKNCDICEHLTDQTNIISTTDKWVVALAPDQGYLGRCYVTLREHKADLHSLDVEEWREFSAIVKKLEAGVTKAYGATPFNWACMMNNAYQVEPAEPHVHWHFRPRYKEVVEVNGLIFNDPLYGHHYDREQRQRVDDKTFQAILHKIKSNF